MANFPGDFPDMELPGRQPASPPPPPPLAPIPSPSAPSTSYWREGDRVLAPWEPDCLYVGTVRQLAQNQALIQFADGDSGWVFVQQLRPPSFRKGDTVGCRREKGWQYHEAKVFEQRDDFVYVGFADGTEDWVSESNVRVVCDAAGPGAQPVGLASQQRLADKLEPGDRVWAPWDAGVLFAGTVHETSEHEVHVHFDDGDRGWVLKQQVIPLEFPVGLRVAGRWKMGPSYFPGTVDAVDGEKVHIRYDDGDQEWTKPAALAIACEPIGPNARPTKTAWRFNMSGWIVPIGIALAIFVARQGCR